MNSDTRDCPMCGEEIKAAASKCRHCGEILDERLLAAREAKAGGGVRRIAKYQKGILVCILINLLLIAAQGAYPDLRVLFGLASIPVAVIATACVFLLSRELYSTWVGVVLGILVLVPFVGLIVLVAISSTATARLKAEGIHVGLLGANLSQL